VSPPTNFVTFLFTDIEASSRLWEEEGERMSVAIARHDHLARTLVEQHHGVVVKSTGDGIHAVFKDALGALETAVALQRALLDPVATNGIALRVRCGIHAGAAEARAGDFFGTAVNRGARIMSAAHGGQTLVSRVAIESLNGRIPPGISLRDLGVVRLRDLAAPEHLFQVVAVGLPQDFPPLRSLESAPGNLPQLVSTFIGRTHEIDEIRTLLGTTRLLTLVGPGGIGKTRLSLQVAAEALDTYLDGVWFVEFAAATAPEQVPGTVAAALSVREEAHVPLVKTLAGYLKSRKVLLLLDNCEHLIDACARLVDGLLRETVDARILATSREALGVAGEQTYPLRPLSLPQSETQIDAVIASDAVRLFVDRARLAQPQFAMHEGNAAVVARLCTRLDGIPLALELAAARVATMSVAAILERLDDRFRLLRGGSRAALPRQQTLRALIDWSHDLLSGPERTLFARLSVFANGFALDAAEDVAGADDLARAEVSDLLAGLVRKSLVTFDESENRYRMLESIREYANERLQEAGAGTHLRERHCDYYLRLAEKAEPSLAGGPENSLWRARLLDDHDNLRAALAWSLETPGLRPAALRLSGALYLFWISYAMLREGRYWCTAALAQNAADDAAPAHAAKALVGYGALAHMLGDQDAARESLERALALSRTMGDRDLQCRILINLGVASKRQGDFPVARERYAEAIAIAQELRNETRECRTLANLGSLETAAGNPEAAQRLSAHALELARKIGSPILEMHALSNLATVAFDLGDLAAAESHVARGLAIGSEGGFAKDVVFLLRKGGEVAAARGQAIVARDRFEQALSAARKSGDAFDIVSCIDSIACFAATRDACGTAVALFGAADASWETAGLQRSPSDQKRRDASARRCRDALGELFFDAALREGAGLPVERAMADAFALLADVRP
jgi:predicted ATPase/class 3 adenylate cyclase